MATFKTPKLVKQNSAFCPGCGHGIAGKLIWEVLEELNYDQKCICAGAVGCTCLMSQSADMDWIQSQHGRAAAVAVGVKAIRPDSFVFTYQGDGDAGAIGLSETLYCAKRNDPITVFFINNGVFGMTGGQCAPTSLEGQKTTTSPAGCSYDKNGKPLELAEMIAAFDVGYVARGSLANYKEIKKTKEYIKKAVQCQIDGKGYSFVEILSPCPTNWKLSPVASLERLEKEAMQYFSCGELKGEVK